MDELTKIEVRAEPIGDGETSRLTVTGETSIIAMLTLLIAAALGDEDCGDPDCPVHGVDAEADEDEPGLAETS